MKKHSAGFTLVEISIVLVVIALVTGAVIGGQGMIEAARINRAIKEVDTYRAAFKQFTQKHRAYPGDFPRASQIGFTFAMNGDGNGQILWGATGEGGRNEGILAWQHLFSEGLVGQAEMNFVDGDTSAQTVCTPGNTVPTSSFDGNGYAFDYFADRSLDNHIVLGGESADGFPCSAELIATDIIFQIDNKMDDGLPERGAVQTFSAVCVSAGNYDVSGANTCRVAFKMRK